MIGNKGSSDLASIAEASYVLLDKFDFKNVDQLKDALIEANADEYNGVFSLSQANEFLSHWQVADHQPNTASGFSATLFQRIDDDPVNGLQAGDLVLAFRGTETGPLTVVDDLIKADFRELVGNGLAFRQIVDLYNYWQRLITPEGEWARQAHLVLAPTDTPAQAIINESGIPWTIGFEDSGTGLGRVDLNDRLVATTGHSLGGHLATAFTRLFPAWTTRAVTFNGAGYPTGAIPGLSGTALGNIANVFSLLGGEPAFPSADIANLYGDKNIELVTMDSGYGLQQPGDHQPLFIEQDSVYANAFGHGMEQMTDSAAVFDLLLRMDGSLGQMPAATVSSTVNGLFESASPTRSGSLEALVNGLARLFSTGGPIGEQQVDDRQSLHLAINAIRASPSFASLQGQLRVQPLLALGTNETALRAQAEDGDGIAYRYALLNLTPFAVTGDDSLYAAFVASGQGARYDPFTRLGLTDAYLADRAKFSQALLEWNAADASPSMLTADDPWRFEDRTLGIAIDNSDLASELPIDDATYYLFGSAQPDVLIGKGRRDALYGGLGADILDGGEGEDYLEGGAGEDTYIAGHGDAVFDHDGIGQVLFDGDLLIGGVLDGGSGEYRSQDDRYRYTQVGGVLHVQRTTDDAALTVQGFEAGDLAIQLEAPASETPTLIAGSGSSASEVIEGSIDLTVSDLEQLNGYNLPDHIQGLAGRDWIYAWDDGPQTVDNGIVIHSAPDTDTVEGGPDKDFIHGGAGDDRLYATTIADAAAVTAGQGSMALAISGGEAGDFVSGQGGDDALFGSARTDGLFGGQGDDLIYGGGGSDYIDGDWQAVVSPLALDPTTYDYTWYALDDDGGFASTYLFDNHTLGDDRLHGGDGNDVMRGGAGDDQIFGDADDDVLSGDLAGQDADGNPLVPGAMHGDDYLSGGSGDDALDGNGGNDILLGGAGDDFLDGDSRVLIADDAQYLGDDYLEGGAGSDILVGNGGADVLLGGDQDDALFGDVDGLAAHRHGSDVLYGGAGADQLLGQGGDDTLHGGDGADILFGDDADQFVLSGDDQLLGGAGDDQLSGGLGSDVLAGGEDQDSLWGDAGDDRLAGGRGLDYLEGGPGRDRYLFSVGDSPQIDGQTETLLDAPGQGNHIEFAAGVSPNSLKITPVADSGDLVLQYAVSDQVYVENGLVGAIDTLSFADGQALSYRELLASSLPDAVYLNGGAGGELVFGSGAADTLNGAQGDDALVGGPGNDTLDGGVGTNRLIGGSGADSYLVLSNPQSTGHVFTQNRIIDTPDRSSTVRFGAGIAATDLNLLVFGSTALFSTPFNELAIVDGATGLVVDHFEFANGDIYTFAQLSDLLASAPIAISGTSLADSLTGTAGNDTINGGAGDDSLVGGDGRDRLDGGPGSDTLRGGSGYDTYIVDAPADLVFEDAAAGYDWVVASVDYALPENTEALELRGTAAIAGTGNALDNYLKGNSAANVLSGGPGDDQILGGGGLDVLDGGDGDDQLAGDYRVLGGAGNDHMIVRARAGDGNRPVYQLLGGQGDDRYEVLQPHQIYELGTITELADEGTDTLVLRGDRFYLWPGLPDNVENLRYEYSGDLWVGADGLMLRGNALDNRIEIGRPNPDAVTELHGLAGDDVLIGSDADESGNPSLGLFGGEGNDLLRGLGGTDNLYGGPGDDVIDGGPGSDLLSGGQGRDTYVFAPGDSPRGGGMSLIDDSDGGSIIRFTDGVSLGDLKFEKIDQDLHISYSYGDTFIVSNGAVPGAVAWYELASGAVFTQQQAEAPMPMPMSMPENSPPVLTGQPPAIATFEGRPVTVSLAADLFSDPEGEALQIALTLGDAGPLPTWIAFDAAAARLDLDPADGDAGSYTLAVTASDPAGDSASTSISLEITDANFAGGSADAEVLKGTAMADNLDAGPGDDRLYGYAADDRLQGGDGNDRLYGHRGADELLGDNGDDILNGGAGDDRMLGGVGDDRYYVDALGDVVIEDADSGHDRVYSKLDLTLDADLEDLFLQGAANLQGTGNAADNRLNGNQGHNTLNGLSGRDRLYGRKGDDILIGGLGNDTLHGGPGSDRMIGGIGDDRYYIDALADSVIEDADAGYDRLFSTIDTTLAAHVEALTLKGEGHLIGIGNALDNRLNGNPGDNRLRGEGGNDRLYGRDGDDVLIGGVGDDTLNGGLGSDEYQIGRGDGKDRIRETDAGPDGLDRNSLRFADGIRPDELWFSRSGDNLVARIIGAEDQVTVAKWFSSESRPLDLIAAGEGEAIAAQQVEQLVAALATFDVPRASVIELSAVQQDEYTSIVAAHWQSPQAAAV